MTDWKTHYSKRNWNEIDDWWRHYATLSEAKELLEKLGNDLRVQRRNGVETTEDFKKPSEVAQEWKGAAEILLLGELEAYVEGDPAPASEEWEKERSAVEEILSQLLEAQEVTDGDDILSRRMHARQGIELLNKIDLEKKWMSEELALEEQNWFTETIARTTLLAFVAGIHTRSAIGKDMENHAIRGEKTLKSASDGGAQKSREFQASRDEVLSSMQKILDETPPDERPNVAAAARKTFKYGKGKSVDANVRLWNRHKGN